MKVAKVGCQHAGWGDACRGSCEERQEGGRPPALQRFKCSMYQIALRHSLCVQAGETPAEAAVRNVKREAGLSLAPQRFKFLCVTSLLWQHRREEPSGASPPHHSHHDCDLQKPWRTSSACTLSPLMCIPCHRAVSVAHVPMSEQRDDLMCVCRARQR